MSFVDLKLIFYKSNAHSILNTPLTMLNIISLFFYLFPIYRLIFLCTDKNNQSIEIFFTKF